MYFIYIIVFALFRKCRVKTFLSKSCTNSYLLTEFPPLSLLLTTVFLSSLSLSLSFISLFLPRLFYLISDWSNYKQLGSAKRQVEATAVIVSFHSTILNPAPPLPTSPPVASLMAKLSAKKLQLVFWKLPAKFWVKKKRKIYFWSAHNVQQKVASSTKYLCQCVHTKLLCVLSLSLSHSLVICTFTFASAFPRLCLVLPFNYTRAAKRKMFFI